MEDLLNPARRIPKLTKFDVDVPLAMGLRAVEDGKEKQVVGLTIVVPKGASAARLVNFQHKAFIGDLVALKLKPDALDQKLAKQFGPDEAKVIATDLRAVALELMRSPEKLVETLRKHPKLLEAYSVVRCGDRERRAPLRRGPARGRQAGADRFPGHALTDRES